MSQNNRYMAVSVTDTKADTKRAKSGGQSRSTGVQDANVTALERDFGIYKRENEIQMEELRAKVNNIPKGSGAGEHGKDGVGIKSIEQTVTSTESGGENKIEITLTDGKKEEFTVRNGENGIGIASIVQTTKSTEDDGINIITITLTDNSTHTFEVQNGSKGSTGAAGQNGKDGENGKDGANGKDGSNGVSCTHSWNGTVLTVTSASGSSSSDLKGAKGDDGKTPVRGTDFWTPDDINTIKTYVEDVILKGEW